MDRWKGKVAIVTGASSGIGAKISEELVKTGIFVVGLARRLEKLEELSSSLINAKGKLYARQCDVTNEKDFLDVFEWVNVEFGGVDILVNNAGIVSLRRIIDDDIESFRKILDTNILATAIAIKKAVASMKSRDVAGHIINVNSILGHYVPNPVDIKVSLYTASKYAITALTETVRKELATDVNNKIKITSISPGLVKTAIFEVANVSAGEIYNVRPSIDSVDIADGVLYVLGTPHKVQVTELTIRPLNENF